MFMPFVNCIRIPLCFEVDTDAGIAIVDPEVIEIDARLKEFVFSKPFEISGRNIRLVLKGEIEIRKEDDNGDWTIVVTEDEFHNLCVLTEGNKYPTRVIRGLKTPTVTIHGTYRGGNIDIG